MKRNLQYLLLSIMLISSFESKAQTWVWAKSLGSTGYDDNPLMSTDFSGNIIEAVNFRGSACISSQFVSYPKIGINDMLLVKYNTAGALLWWKQFGSNNNVDYEQITGISYDANDNIYITGVFCSETITFGNFVLSKSMWYNGYYVPYANFLVKLDSSGNVLWAKLIAEAGGSFHSNSLTLDDNGNLYVCGLADASVFFGSDTIPSMSFLAKFDANGNKVWVRNAFPFNSSLFPLYTDFYFGQIISKGDKLYVCGTISNDTVAIDTLQMILSNDLVRTAGICEFDTSGNALKLYATNSKRGHSWFNQQMYIDEDNIYLTGAFSDTLIVNSDTIISGSIYDNGFLIKMDNQFNELWVIHFFSIDLTTTFNISKNSQNELIVGGYYMGDLSTGLCTVSAGLPTPVSGIFVAKLDSSGMCNSIINTETGGGAPFDITSLIISNNTPIISGVFPSITFGNYTLQGLGHTDVYIAKIDFTTGVGEQEREGNEALLIYSNPNSGSCTIEIPEALKGNKVLYLQIVNSGGKTVYDKTISNQSKNIQIDLSGNVKGRYVVQLSGKSKKYRGSIVMQ